MTAKYLILKVFLAAATLAGVLAVSGCQKAHPLLSATNATDGNVIPNTSSAQGPGTPVTATPMDGTASAAAGEQTVAGADMQTGANACVAPVHHHRHIARRAHAEVVVNRPPAPVAPPASYVQPPAPAPNYTWTSGYWAWGASNYYWVPGVWAPPTVGYYGYGPRMGVFVGYRPGFRGYRGYYGGGYGRGFYGRRR